MSAVGGVVVSAGRRAFGISLAVVVAVACGGWSWLPADSGGPVPAAVQAAVARGPLTLADIVALAVQNNPQARQAVAQAEAASASYGSARGSYFPTLSLSPVLTTTEGIGGSVRPGSTSSASEALSAAQRTVLTPTLALSYLLFDFGGRRGAVREARATSRAADATNDATVQSTVLQAESAYFGYNAARDVLEAERENVRSAQESRAAAVARYRVGLATVADTLQAATAEAQAELALLSAQGELQTARASVAAVIGTTAQLPFDVAPPSQDLPPVRDVVENVDSLIARAVRERPDLEAAEAQFAGARDQIGVARSAELPSLTLGGSAGRAFAGSLAGNSYALTLGLSIPIFNGLSTQYNVTAAAAQADAAHARADALRVQVANQVFTSYANLKVATARVQASAVALASATESEAVARGRYAEGVGSFIDLIVAQTALATARAQDAQARWGWYTALAQLAHDAGTLDRAGRAHLSMAGDSIPVPRKTP